MEHPFHVAAFGEILWDVLPQKKCLGGAPFNCAAHMNRLGFNTTMISALGDDALGTEALRVISQEQMDSSFIQVQNDFPTGQTDVVLKNGSPSYEFNMPCAWDAISLDEGMLANIASLQLDVFCFGSLVQRSKKSRDTLFSILKIIRSPIIFFDVNLRKEFYTKDVIARSLEYATILKLNNEELPILCSMFGYPQDELAFLKNISFDFNLDGVILTKGSQGAMAWFENTQYQVCPGPVHVVDTVGAGDSFSAAFLFVYAQTHAVQKALEAGSALADFVVSHDGAIPSYTAALKNRIAAFCL